MKSRYGTLPGDTANSHGEIETVFQETKADTQFAKPFVEQLGRDYTKIVDVPVRSKSLPDNFGDGRESQRLLTTEVLKVKKKKKKIQEVS